MYNGGSPFWVWRVGTNHRYFVREPIPKELDHVVDWDHFYWGEFEVCPVTKFKQGHAQGICIESVGKLTKTERKD